MTKFLIRIFTGLSIVLNMLLIYRVCNEHTYKMVVEKNNNKYDYFEFQSSKEPTYIYNPDSNWLYVKGDNGHWTHLDISVHLDSNSYYSFVKLK